MHRLLIFLTLTFQTYYSFGQDIIVKRNNSTIKVSIVQVTKTLVFYRNYESIDSTIENISIEHVAEIIYQNGTHEVIKDHPEKYNVTIPDNLYIDKSDKLYKNGIFFGAMIGMNRISQNHIDTIHHINQDGVLEHRYIDDVDNYFNLSLRVGYKWYFGNSSAWKPGVQFTLLKVGLYFNHNATRIGRNSLSIANIGYANIWKFGEKTGMEANVIFGYNMMNFTALNFSPAHGLNASIEAKYRYRGFCLGLNYSRMDANFNQVDRVSMNVFSIIAGAKL